MDFAEISTLKSIKLWSCLPSVVKSAKKIQDEQHDYGNSDMVVIDKHTLDVSKSEESSEYDESPESEESLSEEEPKVDN
nr:disease resistance protein RPP13-like isoform X1 [Ipomoea trifida]